LGKDLGFTGKWQKSFTSFGQAHRVRFSIQKGCAEGSLERLHSSGESWLTDSSFLSGALKTSELRNRAKISNTRKIKVLHVMQFVHDIIRSCYLAVLSLLDIKRF
jgi:hypothetical protein